MQREPVTPRETALKILEFARTRRYFQETFLNLPLLLEATEKELLSDSSRLEKVDRLISMWFHTIWWMRDRNPERKPSPCFKNLRERIDSILGIDLEEIQAVGNQSLVTPSYE